MNEEWQQLIFQFICVSIDLIECFLNTFILKFNLDSHSTTTFLPKLCIGEGQVILTIETGLLWS